MNIFGYIDIYGKYSFNEQEFNEVDSVLFSFLSYVDFRGILGKKGMLLSDIASSHKVLHNGEYFSSIAVRDATKLLYYIKNANRYKDCLLSNYVYIVDDEVQFSAVSIRYLKNNVYVSFEGTDLTVSGWRENLVLSYLYPTNSHKLSIKYLNDNFTLGFDNIIVGGHSKGGNLALVAAMNANSIIKSKIKKIYSMDGPGLLPKIIDSKEYMSISNRYVHIIPDNSFVGIILENANNYVIKTNIDGIMSHDIVYWEVDGTNLKSATLSNLSRDFKTKINNYLYSLSIEELKNVIENFDLICNAAQIKSFAELKGNREKVFLMISELRKLNPDVRKILIGLLEVMIKTFGGNVYNDFVHNFEILKMKVIS